MGNFLAKEPTHPVVLVPPLFDFSPLSARTRLPRFCFCSTSGGGEEIKALSDDIKAKNNQIAMLEKQILDFVIVSHEALDKSDIVQAIAELRDQLNEKSFELEVKSADNRIIQETLNQKACECEVLQEEVANLKQQLSDALELAQGTKTEELKQKAEESSQSKEQLEHRNRKLAEESSYAKGLASAAAVELKALSEEVAKLMNQNERLAAELAAQKSSVTPRGNKTGTTNKFKRRPYV